MSNLKGRKKNWCRSERRFVRNRTVRCDRSFVRNKINPSIYPDKIKDQIKILYVASKDNADRI